MCRFEWDLRNAVTGDSFNNQALPAPPNQNLWFPRELGGVRICQDGEGREPPNELQNVMSQTLRPQLTKADWTLDMRHYHRCPTCRWQSSCQSVMKLLPLLHLNGTIVVFCCLDFSHGLAPTKAPKSLTQLLWLTAGKWNVFLKCHMPPQPLQHQPSSYEKYTS